VERWYAATIAGAFQMPLPGRIDGASVFDQQNRITSERIRFPCVASIQARDDPLYFVTMRRVGVTVLVGAIGEIANVSRERSTRPGHPDPNIF
jgi:hypothetical protein